MSLFLKAFIRATKISQPVAALILFFTGITVVDAQVIKGHAEDDEGNRISYVSLYVKELQQGTTANENGEFELKASAGSYTCTFRCLGYETVTETVSIDDQSSTVKIVMPINIIELASIRISASGEDPAYGIVRQAVSRAPFHRRMVTEYIADVYIKGSLSIGDIKGLAGLAMDRKMKKALSGSSTVVESVNEIHFKAPDIYNHRVKSSRQVSGIDNNDIVPKIKIGMAVIDIYAPDMKILSTGTFSDYRFAYEGDFVENGMRINKIRVTPKHKNDNLYTGYIYIVEDVWNVYSLDLTTNLMGMNFRLEQHYGEVAENISMPVSGKISLTGKITGISFDGNYNTSIKYSLITPNIKLTTAALTDVSGNSKKEKTEKQLAAITGKGSLSGGDMRKAAKMRSRLVEIADEELRKERGEKKTLEITGRYKFSTDSAATNQDTAYWTAMRPIPLTDSELLTFKKHDSLKLAAVGRDTAARRRNVKKLPLKLTNGHTYRIGSSFSVTYRGLLDINALSFNTVDGFVYEKSGSLEKQISGDRSIALNASAAYAFSRNVFLWNAEISHNYLPRRRAQWTVSAGRETADYAGNNGIAPVINTLSSLLFRVNYPVLYDKRYVRLKNDIDIANGLQLHVSAARSENRHETNHSDYSFFYGKSRNYRPNTPRHDEVNQNPALLNDNVDFQTNVTITYTPRYYYRMNGKRKEPVHSDFPTFRFRWQRGWDNILGGCTDFDYLNAQITQTIEIHNKMKLDYSVESGFFPNNRKMSFREFHHFYANEPAVMRGNSPKYPFQLLPVYTYSVNEWFVSAHAGYTSRRLILKHLPFMSAFIVERISASYLSTPLLRNHTEFGYELDNVFFILKLGIFAGFEGKEYSGFGIRGAINF